MLDIQCLFPSESLKISTSDQMREFDSRAVEEFGVPSIVLMENAGRLTSDVACRLLGTPLGKRICVLAGKGNNGGDGFVAARHLRDAGAQVSVFLVGHHSGVKGDARINLDSLLKTGLEVTPANSLSDVKCSLAESDLIIDAIFGTGLTGDVKGFPAELIKAVNSSSCPVLAVDIPSGLDADTGKILGVCVEADCTVTFALPKVGLLTYPGADYAGRLIVGSIGLPSQLFDEVNIELPMPAWISSHLPRRPANSYKGTYGTLALIAGSNGFTGAAAMAADAAVRAGVGLCTLGIPGSLQNLMAAKLTEVMTRGLPETVEGTLSAKALQPALDLCRKSTVVGIGCGLGHNADTREFVQEFVRTIDRPLVVDADGLNCLAANPRILEGPHSNLIITPHPGEMSRLLGTTTAEIESNRLEAVREAASRFHCVAVLKGARTLIAHPSGRVFVNPTGNPGLATGGTGDVLTGIISGFLAQGVDPIDAAVCGVYIHGKSGDIAAERIGPVGIIARDVIKCIPEALRGMHSLDA
ncbi:MAG TPA: NAD(P)H-hydrate dehydratase [Armatimonadota bacterium]